MADGFREVPRVNYDYDVNQLVTAYEQALKDVQAELNSLFLSDFERAQIIAVEDNIRGILDELRTFSNAWARDVIPQASKDGIAATIYSLGLAGTYEEARKIAKFNGINRELVRSIVADTQDDLLEVTRNVSRKTQTAIRRATADVLRNKATKGITGTQSMSDALAKEIRDKLGVAADTAIRDVTGRRWKLKNYTEVVARSKMMEAHIESTVNEGLERGVNLGVVSRHYGSCSKCTPWEGKILALDPDNTYGYPTIEEARADGLFHPQCSHLITTVRRPDRLPDDIKEINGI